MTLSSDKLKFTQYTYTKYSGKAVVIYIHNWYLLHFLKRSEGKFFLVAHHLDQCL